MDGPKVTKIFGPPGTGKTTTLLDAVDRELEAEVDPADITFVAFTRAAAAEAKQRAAHRFSLDFRELKNFSTIHSLCFRLLEIKPGEVVTFPKLVEFGKGHGYDFTYRSDFFEQREFALRTLGDYYITFNDWRRQLLYPNPEAAFPHFPPPPSERLIGIWTLAGAVRFIAVYNAWKRETGVVDFTDMLEQVLRRQLSPEPEVLLVDEAQDCSPLQWRLIDLWSRRVQRFYLAGDDDQCVPKGTLVATPAGPVSIEALKTGSLVSASIGGQIVSAEVEQVFQRNYTGDLIVIKTPSSELRITPDHLVPCKPDVRGKDTHYYTYLMHRPDLGWRIGSTENLSMRLNTERTAAYIVGLRASPSRDEAKYWEKLYSLKYGIPTVVFQPRGEARLVENGYLPDKWTQSLYQDLDVDSSILRLAQDLSIRLDYPHDFKKGVNRSQSQRVLVNLELLATRQSKMRRIRVRAVRKDVGVTPWRQIGVSTSSADFIKWAESQGFSWRKGRGGTSRLRIRDYSLESALATARRLAQGPGALLVRTAAVGPKSKVAEATNKKPSLFLVPARNLLPGLLVAVRHGESTSYERVLEVSHEEYEGPVYDLRIKDYHNFIAGGVVIHNCLFEWSGSSPELLLNYPATSERVLSQSYRVPHKVHSVAQAIISRNKVRKEKDYKPRAAEGVISYTPSLSSLKLSDLPGSIFILTRNRYQLEPIAEALMFQGVPFRNLRGPDPINTGKLAGAQALLQLSRGQPVTAAQMAGAIEYIPSAPYLKRGFKRVVRALAEKSPESELLVSDIHDNTNPIFWETLARGASMDMLQADRKEKALLTSILASGNAEPRVTIGTVHSVKGMEASWVILLPDMARRTYDEFMKNPEPERRVWYVGATRAREGVIVLAPQTGLSFRIPKAGG